MEFEFWPSLFDLAKDILLLSFGSGLTVLVAWLAARRQARQDDEARKNSLADKRSSQTSEEARTVLDRIATLQNVLITSSPGRYEGWDFDKQQVADVTAAADLIPTARVRELIKSGCSLLDSWNWRLLAEYGDDRENDRSGATGHQRKVLGWIREVAAAAVRGDEADPPAAAKIEALLDRVELAENRWFADHSDE